jgi:hypothetical protein
MKAIVRLIYLPLACTVLANLTSCASTAEITQEARGLVQTQKAALAAAPPCCNDLTQISFLPVGTISQKFEVTPGPARVFEQGKSYFIPVAISESAEESFLLIKTVPIQWRLHGLPYIFKPSAVAFDDNFVESGKWIDLPLCFSRGWSSANTGYFSVIELAPKTQSKLIFFTTAAALENSTHYGNSVSSGGIGYAVNIDVQYDFPNAPLGKLEIGPLSSDMKETLQKQCPQIFENPARH